LAQALKVNATRAASPALHTIESIIEISTRAPRTSTDHLRRGRAAKALRGEWSLAGEEWPALHPEHAEPGLLDRGVERRRHGQRQHPAGIGGIDHAVVPQAGARVVGMSLDVVLREDRRLEGGFLLGAPGLAFGLEAVASDG